MMIELGKVTAMTKHLSPLPYTDNSLDPGHIQF